MSKNTDTVRGLYNAFAISNGLTVIIGLQYPAL